MDEKAEQLLSAFIRSVNHKGKLQPKDRQRFFELTIHVYRHCLRVTGRMVKERLLMHSLQEELALSLAADFDSFLELLSLYDQRRSS